MEGGGRDGEGARRRSWWWACGLSLSSFSNVVHPHLLLVVGGVRRLRSAFVYAHRRSWVAGVRAPRRRWPLLGCGVRAVFACRPWVWSVLRWWGLLDIVWRGVVVG